MPAEVRRWWLAGKNGWGGTLRAGPQALHVTVTADGVRAGERTMSLARRPGGPADPAANPASVGGVALPRNVHASGQELLLAARQRRRILRRDPESGELRAWIGLEPLSPGGPGAPGVILTGVGDLLIVAEEGRPRVLALHPGVPLVFDATALPADRRIRDLAPTAGGMVLILAVSEAAAGELWCWEPGADAPRLTATVPPAADPAAEPSRLLVDGAGAIYVFDGAGARALELGARPEKEGWRPLAELADRFAPLPVVIEPDPEHGWRLRVAPADAPRPYPWPAPPAWPAYDPEGRRLELAPEAPVGPPPYLASGSVEIGPLDGRVPRVVWDRLELELAALPAGTAIELRTRTADATAAEPGFAEWSAAHRVTGTTRRAPDRVDFAVLSPAGRYLWVELRLEGGAATPELRSLSAAYPRRGMIDFLPLVHRETDQDTRFLERLVGALERTWDPLENAVGEFHRELRAETASGPAMLDYLGSWFDEPMDPEWSVPARRHTVRHGGRYLFRRGTPSAVRAALRLFLANRWGLVPESLGDTPFLWEHFRSRMPLHAADTPDTGDGRTAGRLFGTEVLRRLRLGSSALGEGTLRDLGSPETDPVTVDAHRFSVFVPRALIPGGDDIRALRNVLAREQPAQAAAELVLVEPRLRVGLQATLGVDTILGVYPIARLAATPEQRDDAPPARLDYDCLLGDTEPGARPDTPALGGDAALPWRIT
ncbi:MAG: hypothetical protein HY704_09610 [Gemmatimonadetes bacterium]|nr:hypothetical protein [Gemmatimonadota bacterium]